MMFKKNVSTLKKISENYENKEWEANICVSGHGKNDLNFWAVYRKERQKTIPFSPVTQYEVTKSSQKSFKIFSF